MPEQLADAGAEGLPGAPQGAGRGVEGAAGGVARARGGPGAGRGDVAGGDAADVDVTFGPIEQAFGDQGEAAAGDGCAGLEPGRGQAGGIGGDCRCPQGATHADEIGEARDIEADALARLDVDTEIECAPCEVDAPPPREC